MATATAQLNTRVPAVPAAEWRENGLIKWATELLDTVLRLRARQLEPTPEVRRRIEELLQRFKEQSGQAGYQREQIEVAQFALVAIVDETVLTGGWPQRDEWLRRQLLLQFFGRAYAGEEFFTRLKDLRQAGADNTEVVEVYYLCLLLGYRGQYLLHEREQLQREIAETADHLAAHKRLAAATLAARGLATDQPTARVDVNWTRWAKVGGVWLWALSLSYLILSYLLDRQLNQAVKDLLR